MSTNIWASKRLVYRTVEEGDDEVLLSIENHAEGFANAGPMLPRPRTMENMKSYRDYLKSALLAVFICLPPDSPDAPPPKPEQKDDKPVPAHKKMIPVGCISMGGARDDMSHNRSTQIGITLAPEFQGKGYGSEAILWATEWAFQYANMHRVGIGGFTHNMRAVNLYRRLGFVDEGRTREAVFHKGRFSDIIELGMLRPEWEALYGPKEDEEETEETLPAREKKV